ncbi:oxidoreductase [Planctomycetales bacterium]|nr:oxidoreductase [Planctomycetales bacterium]
MRYPPPLAALETARVEVVEELANSETAAENSPRSPTSPEFNAVAVRALVNKLRPLPTNGSNDCLAMPDRPVRQPIQGGEQMINVGILGAGNIAEKMAKTLTGLSRATFGAIGSRSLEKAKTFAEKNKADKFYGSYEELVNDQSLDLIYIATPHSFHFEHAKLALSAGRNVLVEKAFTVNAKQAQALIDLAKSKNLLLAEAIWTRYLPMHIKMRELVDAGAVGEPLKLTANLGYNLMSKDRIIKPELAGGALLDLGVYTLNFALTAFGNDIKSVASTVELMASGLDKSEHITFTYGDGRMAQLYSTAAENTDRMGIITGTKGKIEFHNINNCEKIILTNESGVTEINPPEQITGFEYEVESCRRAIETGQTECAEMPHAEIMRVMKIMDGLREEWGVKYPFEV